jgi:hypothetical protein
MEHCVCRYAALDQVIVTRFYGKVDRLRRKTPDLRILGYRSYWPGVRLLSWNNAQVLVCR